MLAKYDKFVKAFQKKIDKYFEEYSAYIYCHQGCSACCEIGEYPFSWIEMGYLMEAFAKLPEDLKLKIKQNIEQIKIQKENFKGERFEYRCPFLIDGLCSVYSNRGLTCRTHGLAYLRKNGTVNIPHCANNGLNYSKVFHKAILCHFYLLLVHLFLRYPNVPYIYKLHLLHILLRLN